PKVMHEQLGHLLDAASLPNITLQVIPYDAGAHPGMAGSFVYMEVREPGDPEVVYVDTLTGEHFLESDAGIRTCASMFDHFPPAALSPTKTKGMISTVRETLKDG